MLSSIYSWFFSDSHNLQSKSNPELSKLLDDESNQGLSSINAIKDVSSILYNKVQTATTSTIQQLSEINYSYYVYQGYQMAHHTTSYLFETVGKISNQFQTPTKYDTFSENILPMKPKLPAIYDNDSEFIVICGICFDRAKDRILFPCGHTFCQVCTVGFNNCPICRSPINGTMKMYL